MRVLAIGAHPDDIENFAGGTMHLYAQQGAEIFIAVATRGDIGSPSGTREAIALTRRAEAEAACAMIGATLIWMGYDDEFLFNNRETRVSFMDAIREARPDVMFILSEDDYHPDHRTAGTIGRDSRIPASVPLIQTRFPATSIPTTFIMDAFADDSSVFDAEYYVDISSVEHLKQEMLAKHVSQVAWMGAVFETQMDSDTKNRDRRRGKEAGVEYAEAFRMLHDYPVTGGPELLPGFLPAR